MALPANEFAHRLVAPFFVKVGLLPSYILCKNGPEAVITNVAKPKLEAVDPGD